MNLILILLQCPPKGATIPYRPKPTVMTAAAAAAALSANAAAASTGPVVFAGGQAYTIQGQYAIPHLTPTDVSPR